MIGSRLGHYHLLEKIGAGGMGEVYRARDERLQRDVALKVLPAGTLASEDARRRFRREALALSKIDHPNIATVHDFDTQETPQGSLDFLVMGLVPGSGLDQKLRDGPLPAEEAMGLGVQMLEGLLAAHQEGVVHRDLKPSNLRVGPEGRLRILDFGLAALRRDEVGSVTSTESMSRAVVGTLPYMAPEQLRGQVADKRTDIWGAGALLYEMVTGRRPFPEAGPLLVDAILHESPKEPRELNHEVPPSLQAVILRALEKDPAHRYRSASEMLLALKDLRSQSSTPEMPLRVRERLRGRLALAGVLAVSILLLVAGIAFLRGRLTSTRHGPISSLAVLPLANDSGNAEQDYLADGMTEALITDMAKIRALKVISRTSVMHYKATSKTLPEIARELGVEAVVEGSVARAGNRVRVTAQLVDAASDRNLWAETYDRDLGDVLAMQAEVARAVAAEVRVQVTPQEQARFGVPRPVPPEAYEAYLRGRYHWNKRTEDDLKLAVSHFQRAIDVDPGYALAYSGLADAYFYRGYAFGALAPRDAMPKAKEAALQALALDPQLGEADTSLAMILYFFDWRFAEAEASITRALALSPNYPTAHHFKAVYLWTRYQRAEEAMAEVRRALELDPLSVPLNNLAGLISSGAHRAQETAKVGRTLIELDPDYSAGHRYLADAYEQEGRREDALAEYLKGEALDKADEHTLAELTTAYRSGGFKSFRRKQSELAVEAARRTPPTYHWRLVDLAEDYARLDRKDEAFRLLEKAYEERSGAMLWLNADDAYDGLRSDPRFVDLLRRVGLPEAKVP
jgi:serine/threonine-protein kinase